MNAVAPYDWAGFFNQRLHSTGAHAPLDGIQRSGWKLVYDGVRSDYWKAEEDDRKLADLSYSLGLKVKEDGMIEDAVFDGPAKKAGIAPATK
jgi:predicted metalloprotease with PDZ domain